MVDKVRYAALFQEALRRARQLAGLSDDPIATVVEYHGQPQPPGHITVEQALDRLYLSPERFYRIVDVAVLRADAERQLVFVRPSGHAPSPFSETIDPMNLGPFKVLRMLGGGSTS